MSHENDINNNGVLLESAPVCHLLNKIVKITPANFKRLFIGIY